MAYNLTENQKELARWIVQDLRNGIREEEFDFFWIEAGRTLGGLTGDDPDGKIMTRGNVQALCDEGMLRLEGETSGRLGVVVRGRLYEAVESNFGAASTERPRSTMSEYDLTETEKDVLRRLVQKSDEGCFDADEFHFTWGRGENPAKLLGCEDEFRDVRGCLKRVFTDSSQQAPSVEPSDESSPGRSSPRCFA